MEASNKSLSENVKSVMEQTASNMEKANAGGASNATNFTVGDYPKWMRWTIVVSAVVVAVACLTNTIYFMCS